MAESRGIFWLEKRVAGETHIRHSLAQTLRYRLGVSSTRWPLHSKKHVHVKLNSRFSLSFCSCPEACMAAYPYEIPKISLLKSLCRVPPARGLQRNVSCSRCSICRCLSCSGSGANCSQLSIRPARRAMPNLRPSRSRNKPLSSLQSKNKRSCLATGESELKSSLCRPLSLFFWSRKE